MKVIYHIDESSRWEIALNNAVNMLRYGSENGIVFTIEVLANGGAVREYQKGQAGNALCARFTELAGKVSFCACSNALNALSISEESLFPFVKTVPAGVVELAVRQEEGYSYIKP